MLKVGTLFSGIGAPEKALQNLGIDYELKYFCEIDKFAIKSYCAIHGEPEIKNIGDITKIDFTELPKDNVDWQPKVYGKYWKTETERLQELPLFSRNDT